MARNATRYLGALAALVTIAALACTAPATAGDSDVAIIVANKTYRGGIPPVEFADRDASEIERALRTPNLLNVGPAAIKRLDDVTVAEADAWFRADGTPGEELAAFVKQATRGRSAATIYFYYSGHGIAARNDHRGADELHLVLNDTRTAVLARTALSIEAVKLALNKVAPPQGRVIMWVDACFSGLGRDGQPLWDGARMVGDVAAAVKAKPAERVVLLTAAAGSEPAWSDPKRRHGAFTDALLDGLYGGAAGADGQITAASLLSYVSWRTNDRLSKYGRRQSPTLVGDRHAMIATLRPPLPERIPGLKRQLSLRCTLMAASRDPAELKGFLDNECIEDCPCGEAIARHYAAVEAESRGCAAEQRMFEALQSRGAEARAQLEALKSAVVCAAVRDRITSAIAAIGSAEDLVRRKSAAETEARRQTEEESRKRAEGLARRQADEEAKRKAAAEARLQAETDAKRKRDEEAKQRADADAKRKAELDAISSRYKLFRDTTIHTNSCCDAVVFGTSGGGRGYANCMAYCLKQAGCRAFKSDDHICHIYRISSYVHVPGGIVNDWNSSRLQLVPSRGWMAGVLER